MLPRACWEKHQSRLHARNVRQRESPSALRHSHSQVSGAAHRPDADAGAVHLLHDPHVLHLSGRTSVESARSVHYDETVAEIARHNTDLYLPTLSRPDLYCSKAST